jgi:CubicO group peptidase (beta-lactamase class C family)
MGTAIPHSDSRRCIRASRTLVAALAIATPLATPAATCSFDAARAQFLSLIDQENLGGGAIVLGDGDGLLLESYFGSYDSDTQIPIASASKLLSAVRIAQLAERGAIDLDAPVSGYLPQFSGLKGTMTVGQMFSHTSGYGGDSGSLVLFNPNITLAEAVDSIACCMPLPNAWVPGGQFAYGGISMHVAGRVAEVVGGGDWQTQWKAQIGAPLGITRIDWHAFNETTTNYGIAGSARSTLRDYGRVLHMLANGGWSNGVRLMHPSTVTAIFTDRIGDAPIASAPGNAADPVRYGLGNWLDAATSPDDHRFGHSLGAFGFFPFVDLDRPLFGVFMIQGPAGINDAALPVYQSMLTSIATTLDQQPCDRIETFDALAGDGFESPVVDLAAAASRR